MSDSESNSEEVLEFICRKCPGKTFTAAEKDAHRMFHRNQKEKDKKNKPGPKSRTRSRRDPSPAASGVTLFEPVNNGASSPSPNRRTERPAPRTSSRRRADPAPEPTTSTNKKKKSRKNFDDTLIGEWKNGNGA